MKCYSTETKKQHDKDLKTVSSKDPYDMATYYNGVIDIAYGFNREWSNSGILDINDIIQECYYIMIKTWNRMDWVAIRKEAQEPQAYIWSYLKRTITLQARDQINNQRDGIRIPHNKRWEMTETKDVYDFLTQLFPNTWFWENDEKVNFVDEPPERWDNAQLRQAIFKIMEQISNDERRVLCNYYGIGDDPMTYVEVSHYMGKNQNAIRKIKERGLKKLNTVENRLFIESFVDL